MKKTFAKIAWILLVVTVFTTMLVACTKGEGETSQPISVDFISGDTVVNHAASVEEAKQFVQSQPTMEGYLFKGWYLDKGTWTQPVQAEDIADYIQNGKLQVYAYWVKIVDRITITFYNYNGAILWEQAFERGDVDLSFIQAENKPDDEQYTYTFAGWDCDMSDVTQSHYEATPIYTQELRTFQVSYIVDGAVYHTQQIAYGENARVDEVPVPTKPSTAQYDYIFRGWEGNADGITQDCELVARFDEVVREYEVRFYYGDGQTSTQRVAYGSAAQAPGADELTKPSTAQYDYVFVGWDQVFDRVTGDMEIHALYTELLRSYEVDFYVDDILIKSQTVPYGQSATAPEKVVKPSEGGYSYVFRAWDTAFDAITQDTQVHALFDAIPDTHTVRYVDWDGTILFEDKVQTAQSSEYQGPTPTREANDRYTYTFTGWSDSEGLQEVYQDTTVYAQYEAVERTFRVVFRYGHDQSVTIENIPYGTDLQDRENMYGAQVPTDTAKSSTAQYDYTFIDWNRYFGYISCDMEISAIYRETVRKYTVTFVNDGVTVKTQEVEYGAYPTAPELVAFKADTAQYDYTYLGWGITDTDIVTDSGDYVAADPNTSVVQGDITYTAVYLQEIQHYTVRFYNDQTGTSYVEVAQIVVPYGTDLTDPSGEYYGQIPVVSKDSTVKYEYTFAGWDKDLSLIESDTNVYATYTSTIRKYQVTFLNGEAVWAEYSVEYGTASPLPEDPTKPSTAQYDYVFLGWIGNTKYIEGDTVIEANYRNDLRYYSVTFFDLTTNQFIETVEMGYGSAITKTIEREGYTFDSWYKDPQCSAVSGGTVDGPMTLFGNLVMDGFTFSGDTVTGYNGTNRNVIVPKAAGGRQITKIKGGDWKTDGGAFQDSTAFDTIYIPNTIQKVEDYAFKGVENVKIFVQSDKNWVGLPPGWGGYWAATYVGDLTASGKEIVYNILGIYGVGDYSYIMNGDGYAIINQFLNNATAKAYIQEQVNFDQITFRAQEYVDEKTQITYTLYEADKTNLTYAITNIAQRAFRNAKNLTSVFIPETISKIEAYAFSGVSANIYIQREKPLMGDVPLEINGDSWNINWNKNEGSDEGTRVLYWGVIDMAGVGDYEYIFMNDGTAIATRYLGSTAAISVEVPASVRYGEADYTVTELGAELFANMTILGTVKLNEGLRKIGNKAFYMDFMLREIHIPSTVTNIGDFAFVGANSLKQIYIPAPTKVGMFCFAGSSVEIFCGREKEPVWGIDGFGMYWNIKLGFEDISKLTDISGIWDLVTNPTYLTTHYNVLPEDMPQ